MGLNRTDEAFPASLSDTSGLPYRVRTRGAALAYPIIICGFGLCMDGLFAFQLTRDPGPTVQWAALGVIAFGAACFFVLFRTLTPHVVFYPDRLEKRSLTGWRTLMRADVQGVRSAGSDRAGAMFQIAPREGMGAPVVLRQSLRKDPVVIRWLKGAPDLDAQELAADTSSILADPRYGATPAERQARLDNAKRLSQVFNVGCIAIAVGLLFLFPGQYLARLAIAAGAFAIGALLIQWSQGLLVWFPRTKARSGVLGAFAPALAVAYQALNFDLIGGMTLVWIAGAAAVAIAVALAARNPGSWLTVPFTAFYGGLVIYGLAVTANVAFAPPGARVFPLLVNDKYTSGSKNRSYDLKVAAWDDQPAGAISVPSDYYYKVQVGSLVCVSRHKGGLGVEWIDVHDCPPGSKAPVVALVRSASSLPAAPVPKPGDTSAFATAEYYPEAARKAGKEGTAVLRCRVFQDHWLTGCKVLSETPSGLGFGAAALQRVMEPGLGVNTAELKGHAVVDVPIHFKLAH